MNNFKESSSLSVFQQLLFLFMLLMFSVLSFFFDYGDHSLIQGIVLLYTSGVILSFLTIVSFVVISEAFGACFQEKRVQVFKKNLGKIDIVLSTFMHHWALVGAKDRNITPDEFIRDELKTFVEMMTLSFLSYVGLVFAISVVAKEKHLLKRTFLGLFSYKRHYENDEIITRDMKVLNLLMTEKNLKENEVLIYFLTFFNSAFGDRTSGKVFSICAQQESILKKYCLNQEDIPLIDSSSYLDSDCEKLEESIDHMRNLLNDQRNEDDNIHISDISVDVEDYDVSNLSLYVDVPVKIINLIKISKKAFDSIAMIMKFGMDYYIVCRWSYLRINNIDDLVRDSEYLPTNDEAYFVIIKKYQELFDEAKNISRELKKIAA
ncbi:MAG: hypothetical protein HQK52_22185 [Oligoflexia bacterium]|nr:hypothetical protein [Oligoflexia bacterium]